MSDVFDFELPAEKIAQRPVLPYDSAKLMQIDRKREVLTDSVFSKITDFLRHDDLLIFNDTKVIPARLFGKSSDTGANFEILLLNKKGGTAWSALGKPLKKIKEGRQIIFSEELSCRVLSRDSEMEITIEFEADPEKLDGLIDKIGNMPIPPYIRGGKSDQADRKDYQTIFAKNAGSIAAPTASLHFTEELKMSITKLGCELAYVTLHVGSASFLPVFAKEDSEISTLNMKKPGREKYLIDPNIITKIKAAKSSGRRVIAVGTTVTRAIESMLLSDGNTPSNSGKSESDTELFITPGFNFKAVDALITNFHQPRSTHLLLVQAFMGRKLLEESYYRALNNDYRFFSYGDGMFIS